MDIIASSQECEEVIELTFRGHKFKVKRKYFHNDENNLDFTTEEQDNDLMWTLFRAYWERRGFEHFYEIDGYKKEQEPTSEDLEKASEEYAYTNWESDDYHEGASEGKPFDAIGHTQKCFIDGAQWQKEQMMKDAIDTRIDKRLADMIGYTGSERVKVIIIKE